MNAEKQFQEVSSWVIQPKMKNSALEMPDYRQMSTMQAKILESIQRQEDEDEMIQGKFTTQLQEDEDELVQGKFTNQLHTDVGKSAIQKKQQMSDDKDGLPSGVRQGMGEAIGGDFSSVQFVTDSQKAVDVGALAFTQGKTVEFAPGQFKPDTSAGLELIGHELTHVDQQAKGNVEPTLEIGGMPVNDDQNKETEADDKGKAAARYVEQKMNG